MARRQPRLAERPASEATLTDLFAAAALTGLLAAQREEPDTVHACLWAEKMGRRMALASRKRQMKPPK